MSGYDSFAAVYDDWSAHMTEDVDFYVSLGLVDVAGLEVEALYGWFDQRPFDDESREFVYVARRPS